MFKAKCDFLLCFTLRFCKCFFKRLFFTIYVHNSVFLLSLLACDKEAIFPNFREKANNFSEIVILSDKMEKCFARINYLNNNCIKLLFYFHYAWIIKCLCMVIKIIWYIWICFAWKIVFVVIQDVLKDLEQTLNSVIIHCNKDFLRKTPGSKPIYFFKYTRASDIRIFAHHRNNGEDIFEKSLAECIYIYIFSVKCHGIKLSARIAL